MEEKKAFSLKRALQLAGALIAYIIGSGYATGQEIIQFFTSYGIYGIFGAAIIMVLYAYMATIMLNYGYHHKDLPYQGAKTGAFTYYLGKIFGTFLQWFTPFFLFLVFIMMAAGAGTTLKQYFGVPQLVGSSAMIILCYVVTLFGLKKLVDIISWIGPAAVIFTVIVSLYALASNPEGLSHIAENQHYLDQMPKATEGAHFWLLAAFLYIAYNYVGTMPFYVESARFVGSAREAKAGGAIGICALMLSIILLALAHLAYLPQITGLDVPNLYFTEMIHPVFSLLYIACILGAVFTTAAPMLWIATSRIAPEGHKNYKIALLVITIIALFAGNLPYASLINVIYPISGYIGGAAVIIILVRHIYDKIKKNTNFEKGRA